MVVIFPSSRNKKGKSAESSLAQEAKIRKVIKDGGLKSSTRMLRVETLHHSKP